MSSIASTTKSTGLLTINFTNPDGVAISAFLKKHRLGNTHVEVCRVQHFTVGGETKHYEDSRDIISEGESSLVIFHEISIVDGEIVKETLEATLDTYKRSGTECLYQLHVINGRMIVDHTSDSSLAMRSTGDETITVKRI